MLAAADFEVTAPSGMAAGMTQLPSTVSLQPRPKSGDRGIKWDGSQFANWVACWLILPNLPYLWITLLGGPPRYSEIVMCGAVGLAVRRTNYIVRVAAFVTMMAFMLAAFIAHMFNMDIRMLVVVAPLVLGINPGASTEYVVAAGALFLTLAVACWLLRSSSAFRGVRWLLGAACATLLLAAGDYLISRDAMGSYSRLAPEGAPFDSATKETSLTHLADGKTNIMLVMVEAMGEPRRGPLRDRLDQIWMRPELEDKYEIVRGTTPFYGSTTTGEVRELCQRWGNYPEIDQPDPSCLPAVLAARGYQTSSYHGFHSDFFDRTKWYPLIGFQRSFFGEELLAEHVRYCPNVFAGACDADIANRISQRLVEASKPQFVYWLTLNSHLPIAENRELGTENCSRLGEPSDRELPMVCRLFAVWQGTADALFAAIARPDFPPTDILVVGDHMPPLTNQRSRVQFDPERVPWILYRYRGPNSAN